VKRLAAASAAAAVLALAVPGASLAQTAPPPGTTGTGVQASPLNLEAVPPDQRDAVWEQSARKNVISVNILVPLTGIIVTATASNLGLGVVGGLSLPVEYERSLNKGVSVFGILWPGLATLGGNTQFGLTLGAGARAYFSGNAPQGFWFGLEVDGAVTSLNVAGRAEAGVNWIFANNFTLSLGGGLGVAYATTVNPATGQTITGVIPSLGLRFNLGYAF